MMRVLSLPILLSLLLPGPAAAQLDCMIHRQQFEAGACRGFVLNMCFQPVDCAISLEGITAGGGAISEQRSQALEHRTSLVMTVEGVASCGALNIQCFPLNEAPRR